MGGLFEHASFRANDEVRNDRTEKEGEAETRTRFVVVIFPSSAWVQDRVAASSPKHQIDHGHP